MGWYFKILFNTPHITFSVVVMSVLYIDKRCLYGEYGIAGLCCLYVGK